MRRCQALLTLLAAASVVVGSWILPAAALADGPGRCYPPPCTVAPPGAVAQGVTVGSQPVVLVGPAGTGSAGESPVLDVVIGLCAVVGSLSVIAVRRRMGILPRRAPEPGVAPAPARPRQVRSGERVSLS